MSQESEIPAEVLRFIDESIDSVPQLETLIMMSQSEPRGWKLEEVAARNYTTPFQAHDVLSALGRRHLVRFDEHGTNYWYSPDNEAIRALVAEVARCYQLHLSRIATLIHAKPSASVKEFARAFELKRDR